MLNNMFCSILLTIFLFLIKDISARRYEPTFEAVIEDINWPPKNIYNKSILNDIGEIAGITAVGNGLIVLFHRGDRHWTEKTFDLNNVYAHVEKGPINVNSVLLINSSDLSVLDAWGKKTFYMPHGASTDHKGNVWLTDVALHQVFRYKNGEWDKPDLVFGEAFVPGSDLKHFCKPTDVAVSMFNDVYISDGYCNSRIVHIFPSGKTVEIFGTMDNIRVPHSLTLIQQTVLCVADRENARVICYEVPVGKHLFQISHPALEKVYAIDHIDEKIFALNGPIEQLIGKEKQALGLTIDTISGKVINQWLFKDELSFAHDISITPEGDYLYVTDIGLNGKSKIYRFQIY